MRFGESHERRKNFSVSGIKFEEAVIYLFIEMTSSQLDIYEFGVHMKDWAKNIDLGNHQPVSESWGPGGRDCQGERKREQFISKTITDHIQIIFSF